MTKKHLEGAQERENEEKKQSYNESIGKFNVFNEKIEDKLTFKAWLETKSGLSKEKQTALLRFHTARQYEEMMRNICDHQDNNKQKYDELEKKRFLSKNPNRGISLCVATFVLQTLVDQQTMLGQEGIMDLKYIFQKNILNNDADGTNALSHIESLRNQINRDYEHKTMKDMLDKVLSSPDSDEARESHGLHGSAYAQIVQMVKILNYVVSDKLEGRFEGVKEKGLNAFTRPSDLYKAVGEVVEDMADIKS